MTQLPPESPVIEVSPGPNVYTILLLVAIIVLAAGIAAAFWKLTSPLPVGYGLTIKEFLDPIK